MKWKSQIRLIDRRILMGAKRGSCEAGETQNQLDCQTNAIKHLMFFLLLVHISFDVRRNYAKIKDNFECRPNRCRQSRRKLCKESWKNRFPSTFLLLLLVEIWRRKCNVTKKKKIFEAR